MPAQTTAATSSQATTSTKAFAARTGDGSPPGRDRLAAEVALIAQARKALEAGSVGEAGTLLARHRSSFPGGQLNAERTALEVRARCLVKDDVGARRLLAELDLLSKSSSLRRAVERACGPAVFE